MTEIVRPRNIEEHRLALQEQLFLMYIGAKDSSLVGALKRIRDKSVGLELDVVDEPELELYFMNENTLGLAAFEDEETKRRLQKKALSDAKAYWEEKLEDTSLQPRVVHFGRAHLNWIDEVASKISN